MPSALVADKVSKLCHSYTKNILGTAATFTLLALAFNLYIHSLWYDFTIVIGDVCLSTFFTISLIHIFFNVGLLTLRIDLTVQRDLSLMSSPS